MPKESNRDIKDRVKKVMPENEWLKNVSKSLGFASLDVVKELIPNTASTVNWNKNVINPAELIRTVRDNNGVRNMFNKQIKNLPHLKMMQEAKANALADLRSGNIYNQNRGLGMTDDGEFDFSFEDTGDFEIIDDDGSGGNFDTSDEDRGGRPPVTVINTMPLAKAMATSTEATINTMTAIAEQNVSLETEKMMMDRQTFNATIGALDTINSNLALLVQFNSDSTAKYQAAALKYFEESLAAMEKPEEEKKPKGKIFNPFTAEGGIKLDDYAQIIKENLADIKDSNIALSGMYDFFKNPELFDGLIKNPLGFMMSEGMKKLIPKAMKSSLKKLDKNANAIIPAILARINTFEGSDDPLLEYLNKIFGSNRKVSYDVDLGEYEKGAISWDGESKKALVEVIPAYLRRIESILGGTDERVYNFSTGKFDDINSIKKYYEDRMARAETSGFTSVRAEINDVVRKLDLSGDARKQFDADIEAYFREMTKKGHLIRHNEKDLLKAADFEKIFDYDVNRSKLVKRVLDMLPVHIKNEMATTAIADSKERTQRLVDEDRLNPNLSGYAVLNHDKDEFGRQRYKGNKLAIETEKDRFGLGQLDYLRDIRSALINGIRVFPDHRKRFANGMPNAGILNRERAENEAYEAQLREEEARRQAEEERKRNSYDSRGNTIAAAANMRESEWNRRTGHFRQDIEDQGTVVEHIDRLNDRVEDVLYEILYGEDDVRDKAAAKLKELYKTGKFIPNPTKAPP